MDTGGSSSVEHQDVAAKVPELVTKETDVLGMPGVSDWGPMNQATDLVSWAHFQQIFGYLRSDYESPVQAKQFFDGKGSRMVFVRVCHIDANGDPVSAARAMYTFSSGAGSATAGTVLATGVGPYALDHGDTLVGAVDKKTDETATIIAHEASIVSVSAENYALSDGMTLTVKVNRGAEQTVTFNAPDFADISAATAAEVAAVMNAQLSGVAVTSTAKVIMRSDRKGTSAYLQITGGTANAKLNFSTLEVQGTGNVANSDSVSITELKTIIEAAWVSYGHSGVTVSSDSGKLRITSNTTGTGSCIQVQAASSADAKIGLDNLEHCGTTGAAQSTLLIEGKYYGARGNNFTVAITAASNGNAEYFDLTVYESGLKRETWRSLTMDSTATRYVETIINGQDGSKLIRVTDLGMVGTATSRRPANTAATALTGGNDGLANLTDTDFRGTEASRTGMYALDNSLADLLAVPDRVTATTQGYARSYCHDHRSQKIAFIPDPPLGSTKEGMATHAGSFTASGALTGFLWPRVQIPNPDKTIYGSADNITICPSGTHAARMAMNSRKYDDGVAHNPSNEIHGQLHNVVALEGEDPEDDSTRHESNWKDARDYVTPYRINPLRSGRRGSDGVWAVWVDDCMSFDPVTWKSIGQMRTAILARRTIGDYLDTVRTQGNSVEERERDKYAIDAWLLGLTLKGYFSTKKASDAYYVETDPQGVGINNPIVQASEQYVVEVGMATKYSRRFVSLYLAQDQRALDAWIQQQLSSPG